MEDTSCPVWLGGLSVEVDEKILLDLFKTFGPIKNVVILRDNSGKSKPCGFVNFMSREVAEVAAQAVNGCDILGHVVRTRGPSELLAAGQNYAPVAERIPLTDCAFYMDGLQCSLNNGGCAYRHNARARHSNEVCEKWMCWQCEDVQCPRKHPKVLQKNTDQPVQAVPRCPSHNAFKCTGECGFEECNTHFMEVEAFQDHINRGRTKQCTPSAACPECKAVFFSQEERQRHPCLNKLSSSETAGIGGAAFHPAPSHSETCVIQTDRSRSDHSPLFHCCTPSRTPSSMAHNLSDMPTSVLWKSGIPSSSLNKTDSATDKCHCKASRHRPVGRAVGPVTGPAKEPLILCALCGDVYESSGDSLSSFDVPVSGRGHLCPNSPSVRGGDPGVDAESADAGFHKTSSADPEPIGVFWDIENCPVPRGKSAMAIVQKIRETFFNGKREVEFMCVCDISKEKKEIIQELNNAQVTVVHINATSKNAADDKLRQSLRRFAQSYPPPATVILVSGDINFAAELSDLRHRHNLGVICLHNAQAQAALLACAHEARRFDCFTAELPERSLSKPPEEFGMSSELIVNNLPLGRDVQHIKVCLKKLSDNCGGKVVSVTGRTAIVRFPNASCAARAQKRIDKERVFGSPIRVSFSTSASASSPGSPLKNKKAPTTERQDDKSFSSPLRPTRILGNFPQDSSKRDHVTTACDVNLQKKQTDRGPFERSNVGKECSSPIPKRDRESPHSLDSQEELGTKPGEPPPAQMHHFINHHSVFTNNSYTGIWPNPFYQNIMNLSSQSAGFPGITPLAPPLMGNPLTASWLANLQGYAVIDQQRGGVDLLVTNLDETVSEKELKKKLASVFREHCKVYSVLLQSGEGIPLRAFVKVPRLSDAQLSISKVHQQTIFSTRVNVTLATEKDKEFGFLRGKVTSILRDSPLHWLPLNKFLSTFYEKCSQAFDMNCLGLLHDLVVICGKPGNQAISLMSRSLGGIRVSVDRDPFAKDLHNLLKCNNGVLPLVSFAATYWLKYDNKIAVCDKGIPLSEVLAAVPNVKVSDSLMLVWIKQAAVHGGSIVKLLELERELTDLLTPRADFRLPLNIVVSEYQKWFNRSVPFDPAVYGFSSLVDLLEAIPTTVEIVKDGCENYLTLTLKSRMEVFNNNLRVLLENQPDHVVTLGNLVSVYQKTFGHRCKVSNFGFSRLTDLIEAVPHIAKLYGSGDQRIVSLKDKPFKPEKQVLMQNLSRELKELLNTCEDQQLSIGMVMTSYQQHFGRHMKLSEFNARTIEDVLHSLPGLQVVEMDGEKCLTLPSKLTVQTLAANVFDLINRQEGKFVLTSRLPSIHHKYYGHKCSLSQAKLNKLSRCMGNGARVKGTGNDQIICLPTDTVKDQSTDKFETFADELTALLMKFPGFRVARNAFPDAYAQQHGAHIKPKDFGHRNLDQLLAALPHVVEVTHTDSTAILCLKHERLLKVFSREIVDLLSIQPDKALPVHALPAVYQRHFGRLFRTESYGYTTIKQLVKAVPSVLTICQAASKLQLSPVQCFVLETHQLLTHLRGCVTLNRFAPNFQQLYGRPCKAADYGYTRIAELLAAMTHVVEIRGTGVEKMVMLIDHADVVMFGHEAPGNQAPDAAGKTNERSDSETLIIVEEEFQQPQKLQANVQSKDMQDLIELKNSKRREVSTDDPLMAPVPDYLPEPSIRPAAPKRRPVANLISFAGFDMELVFKPQRDAQPNLARSVAAASGTQTANLGQRVTVVEDEMAGISTRAALRETAAGFSRRCAPSQVQGGVLSSVPEGSTVPHEVRVERTRLPTSSQELNSGDKSHKKIRKSKVRLAANFNFGV